MNVFVPEHSEAATPRHLRVTQGMVEDLLYDPAMAIWIFFGVEMDAFQEARTKWIWFGQDVDDRSGYGSGKTLEAFLVLNLAAVLKPDHVGMVVYPTYDQGKNTFWEKYNQFATPLFRAQLGRSEISGDGKEKERKSNLRGGSTHIQHFRNKSQVKMPAPNFGRDAIQLASIDLNWLWLEEANKILGMDGGYGAAMKQLLGRVRRPCFNRDHPLWGNRVTYSSTAELGNHPSEIVHKKIRQRVEAGSPKHVEFAFSVKDFSNLISATGKTFAEEYPDWDGVARLEEHNSPEAFAAEVYGFSSLQGEDWFTAESLERMEVLGEQREVKPVVGRSSDEFASTMDVARAHYFCGIDPAPAKSAKSDFGAVVVLRAAQLPDTPGDNESDYQLDYIYARKIKKFKASQWSGFVHEKHKDFGFGRIVLELGGGGDWIVPELREDKQTIGGVPVEVKPIVEIGFPMITGDPILITLRRRDIELLKLFPEMKHAQGDDKMKDWINTSFQAAVEKGILSVPRHVARWKSEEKALWTTERRWALQHLSLIKEHMGNVAVEKNADGTYKMTAHGAKFFVKKGRDDFHDGARNAYIGFRCWLTTRMAFGGGGSAKGGCGIDVW